MELIQSGTDGFFDKVAIGDFGGNGEFDIAAAPGTFGDLHLFRNVVNRPVAVERSRLIRKPPHGRGAEDSLESLQVADFNTDGRSDQAVMVKWSTQGERSHDWGELQLGGPRGLSERATVFGRGRVGLESMACDVTGDGRPDLVMRDTDGAMSVVPGTSTADITVTENGTVAVLPGGPGGVRPAQAEILDKDSLPQPAAATCVRSAASLSAT